MKSSTASTPRRGAEIAAQTDPILRELCASTRNIIVLFSILVLSGCATWRRYHIPGNRAPEIINMETTGYCSCGTCCGWKRNWKLKPVVAYGPNKGRLKEVGITASGTHADWGTIAADTRFYPFGTIMLVPGYGWGRVEDIGGGIKGMHIDLHFPSHQQALEWGREWKKVKIWKPDR